MFQFTIKIGNAIKISFSKARERWQLLGRATKILGLIASLITISVFIYNFLIIGW